MPATFKKPIFLYALMIAAEFALLFLVARHSGWSLSPYLSGFDTSEYISLAKNLIGNGSFSKSATLPLVPNFFRSPGYPFWLAWIYLMFGSLEPAIFLGMIFFAFSAPLVYLIGREVFSEKLAFMSGIIIAVEPRTIFSAPFILSEQIFLPIFLASVFFLVKFFKQPKSMRYFFLSAALLGLATLVRGIALYLWPVYLVFIFLALYKTLPLSKIFKPALIATGILLLILTPWLIRNRVTLGTWQPNSLFGNQLYWGHLETLKRYLGTSQEIARTDIVERAKQLVGDDFESPKAVEILAEEALSEIARHPIAYAEIYAINFGLYLITDGYKGAASYITDIKPNYINLNDYIIKFQFKKTVSFLKEFSFLETAIPIFGRTLWSIITLAAFLGISISVKNMPRQRPALILFVAFIAYFMILTGPVFSPDPRFRLPVNGFLFMFGLVSVFYVFKINYRYDNI